MCEETGESVSGLLREHPPACRQGSSENVEKQETNQREGPACMSLILLSSVCGERASSGDSHMTAAGERRAVGSGVAPGDQLSLSATPSPSLPQKKKPLSLPQLGD